MFHIGSRTESIGPGVKEDEVSDPLDVVVSEVVKDLLDVFPHVYADGDIVIAPGGMALHEGFQAPRVSFRDSLVPDYHCKERTPKLRAGFVGQPWWPWILGWAG